MSCIKTGARVLLVEYQQVFAADLYAVGDCIIARLNPEPMTIKECTPTHSIEVGDGFLRQDLGILVVPFHYVSPYL